METEKKNEIDEVVKVINQSLDEKLSNHLARVDEKLKKEPQKEEPLFDFELDGEEGDTLTKKDLKNVVTTVVGEVTKNVDKLSKKATNELLAERDKKLNRDLQAFNDFPMMNKQSGNFNKDFLKEVEAEIEVRERRGRNRDSDEDLIYDSAAAVKSRWVEKGLYVPPHLAKKETREADNNDSGFYVNGTGRPADKRVTEGQIEFASRFGLSKDRIVQLREKYGRN